MDLTIPLTSVRENGKTQIYWGENVSTEFFEHDSSVSNDVSMMGNILTSDDVEFPFLDDCPIQKDYSPEAIEYNPYKILAPFGCGKRLDEYG